MVRSAILRAALSSQWSSWEDGTKAQEPETRAVVWIRSAPEALCFQCLFSRQCCHFGRLLGTLKESLPRCFTCTELHREVFSQVLPPWNKLATAAKVHKGQSCCKEPSRSVDKAMKVKTKFQ